MGSLSKAVRVIIRGEGNGKVPRPRRLFQSILLLLKLPGVKACWCTDRKIRETIYLWRISFFLLVVMN